MGTGVEIVRALPCLLMASACQDRDSLVLPSLDDAAASIVLIEDLDAAPGDDRARFPFAEAHPGAPPQPVFDAREGRTRAILIQYRRPLELLGVSAGKLVTAVTGTARRALPRPDALWSATSPGDFEAIEALPDTAAALRVVNGAPCPRLTSRSIELTGSQGHVHEIAAFGDHAVVVLSRAFYRPFESRVFHVTEAGAEELTSLTATLAYGLSAGPGDSVWVGTEAGGLFRYGRDAPDEPLRVLERRRVPLEDGMPSLVRFFDGGEDRGASELYAVTSSGTAVRFGPAAEVLDHVPLAHRVGPSGIVRLGPGHAVGLFQSKLVEYRSGASPRPITPPEDLDFQKLTVVPELGWFLPGEKDISSTLFVAKDGTWSSLPVEGELKTLLTATTPDLGLPFMGGVLLIANRGQAIHVRAYERDADDQPSPLSYGLCTIAELETSNLYTGVVLDERTAVVGGRQFLDEPTTTARVFFLHAE